mmetsp:Transcript_19404/g.49850  ORF Transcript_19404/g.49850 Transcript_19404/m.49850 type:complete len:109 (-) Transcript_19404:291-617(-)
MSSKLLNCCFTAAATCSRPRPGALGGARPTAPRCGHRPPGQRAAVAWQRDSRTQDFGSRLGCWVWTPAGARQEEESEDSILPRLCPFPYQYILLSLRELSARSAAEAA